MRNSGPTLNEASAQTLISNQITRWFQVLDPPVCEGVCGDALLRFGSFFGAGRVPVPPVGSCCFCVPSWLSLTLVLLHRKPTGGPCPPTSASSPSWPFTCSFRRRCARPAELLLHQVQHRCAFVVGGERSSGDVSPGGLGCD